MHFLSQSFLPAQVSLEASLQRNYQFLSYGLTAAWIILAIYVLMMVARERKLKREIASLRAMLEDKKEPRQPRP
jgi:cell division protein FtsL